MNILNKFVIRLAIGAGVCVWGGLLNMAAVMANKGVMPVYMPGCPGGVILDRMHVCADSRNHLLPLIDWFYFHGWIYSIGDVFIFVGQVLAAISILCLGVDFFAPRIFGKSPKKSSP